MKARKKQFSISGSKQTPAEASPALNGGVATSDATDGGAGMSLKPPPVPAPNPAGGPDDDAPRPSPFHMPG